MATELWLRDDLARHWAGQDPFAAAFALEGETYRALEQRQTLAFHIDGRRYFIKRHRGASWGEILKNLLQLRLPVVSAKNEFEAIRRLQALGVRTPVVAAFGRRGWTPGTFESFLVTEDVGPHESLEDFCRHWPEAPPGFREKRMLVEACADLARTMHAAGICHRDFYLCHLLRTGHAEPLTVIDLHRALVRRPLAARWIVKDVAGLHFSSVAIGLTPRDRFRFMCRYRSAGLRETLSRDAGFWRAVEERARKLLAREGRRRG